MPRILSPAQVEQYRRDGFAFPAAVLDAAEVRALRADLEHWEKLQGHPLEYPEKSKSYLLYGWADAIVHHPKVLDAVEDVLGPDILVTTRPCGSRSRIRRPTCAGTRTA